MESPFACFFCKNQEKLTENDFSVTIHARALHERQAVGYILREEVVDMPITITLHILGYVVTIRIKSENRHSAK